MTPIVYLHGFASSPASRKATFFADRLKRRGFSVEIPDLAQGDFEHLTISSQMRVIESLLGGRPATLIGSSMGGYLAALYASRHPEIERLVLLAPAFGFLRHWPTAQWRESGWLPVFHYGERTLRNLSYRIIEDGAQWEDNPDFHQPGLIFHGLRDAVVPSAVSTQFALAHRNVRLELLDSDHELTDVLETIDSGISAFL